MRRTPISQSHPSHFLLHPFPHLLTWASTLVILSTTWPLRWQRYRLCMRSSRRRLALLYLLLPAPSRLSRLQHPLRSLHCPRLLFLLLPLLVRSMIARRRPQGPPLLRSLWTRREQQPLVQVLRRPLVLLRHLHILLHPRLFRLLFQLPSQLLLLGFVPTAPVLAPLPLRLDLVLVQRAARSLVVIR